ncbi:DNA topoisomerase 3-alpha [Galendromus occidentalis]|uniref:DNA topoisomerase n=1 Tax=Galendromus occidentalis TaxID=34638 RepID=A0AAJ6QNS7_9ACAR|nr:DNA topoisomerase 3-alpha [Galendromus occidentalis]
MKVLHVAEKNDAAKNIAAILSNGNHRTCDGLCRYNKIYEFTMPHFRNEANVSARMTSASGHILNFAFPDQYKDWNSIDPLVLFDAPLIQKCETETAEQIRRTLEREIKRCKHLIIWTDNDREGEAIGFEIIDICKRVEPNVRVWRAKFSEITRSSIERALNSLQEPNQLLNYAVLVRSQLDLRIGAAFTRLQTMRVGRRFSATRSNVLSYGSCQFPTLGFVVERYKEIDEFRAERFYKIEVKHVKDELYGEFIWKRGRLFDHSITLILYERLLERPHMKISTIEAKSKAKFRPQPMDTVSLEKLASRKLRMTAKEALAHAEKLYTEGLISYPRTETNKFPPEIQLLPLVEAQCQSPQWGDFATRIVNEWGGPHPRNGNKSDQAHPPIHPTKYAQLNLQDNKGKVYELVVRHFLACVSQDARGSETNVKAAIDEEHFSLNGLQIIERNYLDVYPYEKWSAKVIPSYREGETFTPTEILMSEGRTSAPSLLTEADLIALMEKHGIGTDATHAEHIDKVKQREYIGMADQIHFVPGQIGMGLVEGYDDMGFEMSKPRLRASLENDLMDICEGRKNHQEVLENQIQIYRRTFLNTLQQLNKLSDAMGKYLQQPVQEMLPDSVVREVLPCPLCRQGKMGLRKNRAGDKWFISCMSGCQAVMWLPSNALDNCEVAATRCPSCTDTFEIKFFLKEGKYTSLPREYVACVSCNDTATNLFNLRVVAGNPQAQTSKLHEEVDTSREEERR